MTKAYYSMELDKITGAQENDGERGTFCFISHILTVTQRLPGGL